MLLLVLCEARGLSKTEAWNYSQYKHGCGGTGILRDASVQHQSCIGDHACGARRVTVGFM